MNRRFVIILLVCVAVFVGLFVFNSKDEQQASNQNVDPTSHSTGNPEAKVTLLEYGDFQCPACSGYYPILQAVKEQYGDKINFQFRHFPIVSIHPNAMSAHRAAEAAGNQGKFWEMHDMLYERQDSWKENSNPGSIFEGYAEELQLNMDQYRLDVASPDTKAVIDADIKAGQDAGVTGTPTFFINGKKIDNSPRDVAGFTALIDEILNAQSEQTTQ
jgi:protein-disulfide isomerase